MTMDKPDWIKGKKLASDFEEIEAGKFDNYKDFKTDDSSYCLIKLLWDVNKIAVAICNYEHEILKVFKGRNFNEITNAIFSFEEKNKVTFFKTKPHIAYLGKEIKKAEVALASGYEYIQE